MRVDWNDVEVRPSYFGRNRGKPGSRIDYTWDATPVLDNDLWFIWAGRGRVRIGHKWTQVRFGTCLWLRRGFVIRSNVEQAPDDPLGVTFLHFDLVNRRGRVRRPEAPLPPHFIEPPDAQMVETVTRRLADMAIGFGSSDYARLSGVSADIGAAMLRALLMDLDHFSDPGIHARAALTEHSHERVVRSAASRILESPHDPPAVEALAADFGYSRQHFSRIFKRVTQHTPQEFAIQARVRRAKQLLESTDMKIGKIAEVLGYRDSFFFSRQFKHVTGMTPTRFRRGK